VAGLGATADFAPPAAQLDELVGRWMKSRSAPYPVSLDSIRRFVQAAMISDDIYGSEDPRVVVRFGGIVAPPLYPLSVFVRPLGTPDPFEQFAIDPGWDAAGGVSGYDLPPLETPLTKSLNGGTEAQPLQLARVGDTIYCQARYQEVTARQGRSGPLLIVRVEVRYFEQNGDDLLRTVRTIIRRTPE
jgi:MaoC dehydratase-like protein